MPARGLTVLTGPSGCGKSTVLATLLGDLRAGSGRITVGGADLESLDPGTWREQVAYLPQRPWLLDGTVEDNVRVGRPDAPDEAVRAALDACGLGSISPDTLLGEDGAGLSAGQRARLAMARVVVSDRPYVVLDEPTAHLDTDTEQVLLRVVQRLALDRCVVAVAHSPALVEAADHVVSLPARPVAVAAATAPARASHRDPAGRRAGSPASPVPASPPVRRGDGAGRAGRDGRGGSHRDRGLADHPSRRAPAGPDLLVAIVASAPSGWPARCCGTPSGWSPTTSPCVSWPSSGPGSTTLVVPLVPGRLGRRRGDLLASLVDDVDAAPRRAAPGPDARARPGWARRLVTAAVAWWFLPAAGALVAAGSLVAGAAAWWTARRGAARLAGAGVAARAEVSRRALAVLTDARALVQWQLGKASLDEVDRAGRAQAGAASGAARWLAVARAWPVLAAGAGVAAMAALVAPAVATGTLSALGGRAPPARSRSRWATSSRRWRTPGASGVSTRAATERVQQLAALAPAVTDPEAPEPVPQTGRVRLHDVTAGWDGSTALAPVSLELAPGRALGLVGPSGSGKSTLAALLVRFLAPVTGEQEVGHVPVERLRGDDVRRVVGLLDDDPYLFASSLVENVRLARPGAGDDAVEAALRRAHLGDWLDGLPEGLHTAIGDGAASVSGGERARIGLARLLLADHPVLVLDEPTAHLDAGTAQRVADDLLALRGDRSLVWITHGTVGLDQMDEVLELA